MGIMGVIRINDGRSRQIPDNRLDKSAELCTRLVGYRALLPQLRARRGINIGRLESSFSSFLLACALSSSNIETPQVEHRIWLIGRLVRQPCVVTMKESAGGSE